MKRCASLLVALAFCGAAFAQGTLQRHFPQSALRGRIVFGTPPVITLNGKAATLAPGAHIHGVNNLLVLSGQLAGVKAIVDYTTDFAGNPLQVWILSQAEAAKKPWPTTAAEAAAWTFDASAQTWTKP